MAAGGHWPRRKTCLPPGVRTDQGLATAERAGAAPHRNPWAKQPLGPWPRSRERGARGFPPAPALTPVAKLLGFQGLDPACRKAAALPRPAPPSPSHTPTHRPAPPRLAPPTAPPTAPPRPLEPLPPPRPAPPSPSHRPAPSPYGLASARDDGGALAPWAASAQALSLDLRGRQFRRLVAGKSVGLPRSGAGRRGEVPAAGASGPLGGASPKASFSPGALGVRPSCSGDAAWPRWPR